MPRNSRSRSQLPRTDRTFPKISGVKAVVGIACIVGFWGVTACTKSSEPVHPGGTNSIIGAGSTFIYPIMTRWISAFQQNHPNVQINYQSIGSGGGIQQLKKGLIDFGASDAALDDEQLKEMPALLQIPESAGPVCITYNLPELKSPLKLSAETLSGNFLRQDYELARSENQARQQGREFAQPCDSGVASLRWQRDYEYFHYLPGGSES